MPEVVGPTLCGSVQVDQHHGQVLLRRSVGQGTDLRLQGPQGPFGDEGVDVPLVRSSLAAPLDVEPQEVEPLAQVHDLGLGRRQPQPHRCEHLGDLLAQCLGVLPGPIDQDDEVVRVADQPPRWQAPSPASFAPRAVGQLAAALPRPVQVLIELRQGDVGQQRGEDAPLRRAGHGVPKLTELVQQPGLQERLDQRQHPLVLDPPSDPFHQRCVVDLVEARRDVRVQHPPVTAGAVEVDLGNRVLGPPLGPEPVRDRLEVGLEDRLQHQLQCGLDHPVGDRGNPQPPHLPRPTRLGNLLLPHRKRPKRTRLETGAQVVQEPGDTERLLDVGGAQAVHARSTGSPVARDPVERRDQRRRVVHEVEQIIEPTAAIGRRPTVKFGLHLRYPLTRPRRGLVQQSTAIRRRVFRHCSLLPFSIPLPPFPMCTGFPRLGVLRRLRPTRTVRRSMRLSPTGHWPCTARELRCRRSRNSPGPRSRYSPGAALI